MTQKTIKRILLTIYIVSMVLTVLCYLPHFISVAQNPSTQDDIFDFGPGGEVLLEIAGLTLCHIGVIFLCEYGVYSSLKYFFIAQDKRVIKWFWHILKLMASALIIWQVLYSFFTFLQWRYGI